MGKASSPMKGFWIKTVPTLIPVINCWPFRARVRYGGGGNIGKPVSNGHA